MKRRNKYTMVKDVLVWQDMDGDNTFQKKVNAYLTKMFIGRLDLPSDECVTYAKKFDLKVKDFSLDEKYIKQILDQAFATSIDHLGNTRTHGFFDKTIAAAVSGVMAIYYLELGDYDKTRSKPGDSKAVRTTGKKVPTT